MLFLLLSIALSEINLLNLLVVKPIVDKINIKKIKRKNKIILIVKNNFFIICLLFQLQ